MLPGLLVAFFRQGVNNLKRLKQANNDGSRCRAAVRGCDVQALCDLKRGAYSTQAVAGAVRNQDQCPNHQTGTARPPRLACITHNSVSPLSPHACECPMGGWWAGAEPCRAGDVG